MIFKKFYDNKNNWINNEILKALNDFGIEITIEELVMDSDYFKTIITIKDINTDKLHKAGLKHKLELIS